jgi:hypothetical protein
VTHHAALSADISTDDLSFVHTLRVVHRKLSWFVSFPPRQRSYVSELLGAETLEQRVRRRPGRPYPRGAKRKMSGYHIVTTNTRRAKAIIDPKPRRIRLT